MYKIKFDDQKKRIIENNLGICESEPYLFVLSEKIEDMETDKINIIFPFEKLKDFQENLQFLSLEEPVYLYGKTERGEVRVDIRKVDYIEAFGNDIMVYVGHSKMEINQKLYELEENLKSFGFIRISKSQIVNVSKIISVKSGFNGKLDLVLDSDLKLEVNRSYKKSFRSYLRSK